MYVDVSKYLGMPMPVCISYPKVSYIRGLYDLCVAYMHLYMCIWNKYTSVYEYM